MIKTHLIILNGILLTTIFIIICWGAPLVEDEELLDDMYLNADMLLVLLRNGKIAPPKLWPNATVYYKISPEFDEDHVTQIKTAMAVISYVSCVIFQEADNSTQGYIDITAENRGCVSAVGYRGQPQILNLQKDIRKCTKVPIVTHELLHSLGFFHEQTSYERDDYIQILWENIEPGKQQWFDKLDNTTFRNYGFSYDYDSIMHYGRKAFSVNRMDTIVPLDKDANIGQRIGLSIKDIGKLNAMYNCTSKEADTTTPVMETDARGTI